MEVVRSGRRAGRGRRPTAIPCGVTPGPGPRCGPGISRPTARAPARVDPRRRRRPSGFRHRGDRREAPSPRLRPRAACPPSSLGSGPPRSCAIVRHHRAAQRLPRLLLRGGVSDARVHPEQVIVEQLRKIVRGVRHRTAAPSPALRQGLAPFRSPRGRCLLPRARVFTYWEETRLRSQFSSVPGAVFSGPAKIGRPETKTSRPQGNS